MLTLSVTAAAVISLGLTIFFSQGMRVRNIFCALCGAAIGGVMTLIAVAMFRGLIDISSRLLAVFT